MNIEKVNMKSFFSIEVAYHHYLRGTELGKELLSELIGLLSRTEFPVRIRFIYFYSQEFNYESQDERVFDLLWEAFEANLKLRRKLKVGFQCGISLLESIQS